MVCVEISNSYRFERKEIMAKRIWSILMILAQVEFVIEEFAWVHLVLAMNEYLQFRFGPKVSVVALKVDIPAQLLSNLLFNSSIVLNQLDIGCAFNAHDQFVILVFEEVLSFIVLSIDNSNLQNLRGNTSLHISINVFDQQCKFLSCFIIECNFYLLVWSDLAPLNLYNFRIVEP